MKILNSLQNRLQLAVDQMIARCNRAVQVETKPSNSPNMQQMEERIMMSATPMAEVALDAPQDTSAEGQASESGAVENENVSSTGRLELVVVDSQVAGYEQLVEDLTQDGHANFELVILDADVDGVEQISDILAWYQDVDALHIISHGSAGQVALGNTVLDSNSIEGYAGDVASWADAFSGDADILIYGCDVAASDEGRQLLDELSALTGADVAGSTDTTGNESQGGDWQFEYQVGLVENFVATTQIQTSWNGTLEIAGTGEIQANVNSPVDIGNEEITGDTGRGSDSAVGIASDGSYVVVWTGELNAPGDPSNVYFQRFDQFGNTVGSAIQANQTTAGVQDDASIAVNADGSFVVVWESKQNDTNDIYMRHFNADGTPRGNVSNPDGDEFLVHSSFSNGRQNNPDIDMNSLGQFVIAWEGQGATDFRGIYARTFNADGSAHSDVFHVSSEFAGLDQANASVSINVNGDVYVAWETRDLPVALTIFVDTTVHGRVFNFDGGEITDVIAAPNLFGALETSLPSLDTRESDGRTALVAQSSFFGGDTGLLILIINPDGSFQVDTNNLPFANLSDAGNQAAATVRFHDDNSIIVAWEGPSNAASVNDNQGVYYRQLEAVDVGGGFLEARGLGNPEITINQTTAGYQGAVSIASLDSENFVAVWTGNGPGDGNGVFVRQFGADITLDLDFDDSVVAGNGFEIEFEAGMGPVSVADADALITSQTGQITSLTATINNVIDGAAETLLADTTGTAIVQSYAAGVLTLTGQDSVANYQQVLRTIEYNNSSASPNQSVRTLVFVVENEAGDSVSTTAIIDVTNFTGPFEVNNFPPVFFAEARESQISSGTLRFDDPDNTWDETVYALQALPTHGTLAVRGVGDLGVGDTFTQQQIEDGLLYYTPIQGMFGTDRIQFEVSDGTFAVPFDFEILVGNIVEVGESAVVGTNDIPGTEIFVVTDEPVSYTLVRLPHAGTLYRDTTGLGDLVALTAGESISTAEINSGRIVYTNDGSDTVSDSFEIAITEADPGGGSNFTLNRVVNLRIVGHPELDLDGDDSSGVPGVDFTAEYTPGSPAISVTDADVNLYDFNDIGFETLRVNLSGFLDGNSEIVGVAGEEFNFGEARNVTVASASGSLVSVVFDGTGFAISDDGSGLIDLADLENLIGGFSYRNIDTATTSGLREFEFRVTDQSGLISFPAVSTIEVGKSNVAPSIGTNNLLTVDEGAFKTITTLLLNESDPDDAGADLTYTITTDAINGKLVLNGVDLESTAPNNTFTQADIDAGRLQYVHDGSETTSDSFAFELADGLEDGASPATGVFNILINSVNDDPVASANSFTTNEDVAYTAVLGVNDLLLDDSDAEGDSLTVNLTAIDEPEDGVLVLRSDGTFTYTPNDDFHGSDSFVYEISDGNGGTAQATVSITVNAVNDVPETGPVVLSPMVEDGGVRTISQSDLLVNATDADNDTLVATGLSVSSGTGTLVDNLDGTWDYTPAADDDSGVSFSYTISDSSSSAFGTATLDITPLNDAPVAVANSYDTNEEVGLLTIAGINDLLLNDSDVDGDLLSVETTPVSGPSNGTLTLESDGTFSYDPNQDFFGSDSFVYRISDGNGRFSQATVNINVNPVNDAPVVGTNNTLTVNEGSAGNFITTMHLSGSDVDDIDGDLIYQLTSDVANGTLYLNGVELGIGSEVSQSEIDGGLLSYDHDGSETTNDGFNFTLVDGGEDGVVGVAGVFQIAVNQVNDAPVALDNLYAVSQGGTLTVELDSGLLVNDSDSEGDGLTVTLQSGPSAGSLNYLNDDGTFEYVNDNSSVVSDSFTYQVDDGNGGLAIATVHITVSQNGFIQTGEFLVNSIADNDQNTATGTDTFSESAVASRSNGDYVVVWTGGSFDDVFVQRYDFSGNPLGDPIEITAGLEGEHRSASVGIAEDGSFVVAWENVDSGGSIDGTQSSVYFQKFDFAGNATTEVTQVNDGAFAAGSQTNPDVSVNSSGHFVVSYSGQGPGGINNDTFFSTYNPDGSLIAGPTTANDEVSGSGRESNIQIVISDTNRVFAAWDDGDEIHSREFDLDGNRVGPEGRILLTSQITSTQNTSVDISPDGLVAVATELTRPDGTTDIQLTVIDRANLESTSIIVNQTIAGNQQNPSVSWGNDGSIIVTYDGAGDGDNAGVFARQFLVDVSPGGELSAQAVGNAFLINESTAGVQAGASVTAIDNGNFVVVWTGVDDSGTGVYARQFGNQDSFELTGQVLEKDFVDDGFGNISLVDGDAFADATVKLYRDDGDGVIGAGDVEIRIPTQSDASGNYTFVGLQSGAQYWVVVDSRSLELESTELNAGQSFANAWAEQTYGDGGVKIGGLTAGVSDDASTLVTSQHVSGVTIAGDEGGVDFGFSYDVVTNTLGGGVYDAVTDSYTADIEQGSLRQFITNANTISGANDLHFVPGVAATDTAGTAAWWEVAVGVALPTITDANTTIDGRAYDDTGLSRLNTNTELLGSVGVEVGTGSDGIAGLGPGGHILTGVEAVELEIHDIFGVAHGIRINAANVEVAHLSVHGFGAGDVTDSANIFVGDLGQNAYIHDNLIGSEANVFAEPTTALDSGYAIFSLSADGGTIEDNLIGFTEWGGIKLFGTSGNGSDNWKIDRNEIHQVAEGRLINDGVDVVHSENAQITNNLFAGTTGFGVDTFRSGGSNTIAGNTVTGNGHGGVETGGIRLFGSNNLVEHNVIVGNEGAGIVVVGQFTNSTRPGGSFSASTGNEITQNAFGANAGVAIDLVSASIDKDFHGTGDGVSENGTVDDTDAGNDGIDHPNLVDAFVDADGLHLAGLIDPTRTYDRIEVYVANSGAGDQLGIYNFGEGTAFIDDIAGADISIDAAGNFVALLVEPAGGWPVTVEGGVQISLIAIEATTLNTSEFGRVATINHVPTPLASSVTVDEDTTYLFQAGDFQFNDVESLALDHIVIESLPTDGTLLFDDLPVTSGTVVLLSQIGDLAFVPDENANGAAYATFEFSVNDGTQASSVIAEMTINVTSINDAPVATDGVEQTNEDTQLFGDVSTNVSDVENDVLTYTLSTGPANGTLTLSTDGTFTYLPTGDFHGTDSFTYLIDDGNGGTAIGSVDITVAAVNDVPIATSDDISVDEDDVVAGDLGPNASDVDGDMLTFEVATDVSNGTLELNADGTFTYTPDAEFHGTDSFSYLVDDGNGETAVATVSITVESVNDVPVTTDDVLLANEDEALTGDLSPNASDVDGDTLVFSVATSASNGVLVLNGNGTFTYTPNGDFNGTDSFTYQVEDGNGGMALGAVQITVAALNDAPIATAADISVNEDDVVTGDLGPSASDIDGDTLTFHVDTDVSNGTLELNPDGSFTYAPDTNFHGTDSFSYLVEDASGETSVATVSITIESVNDLPVVTGDELTTDEDEVLTGDLALTASDVDDDTLVFTLETGASNGTVILNGNGTFTYTPNGDFNGPDSFTYHVDDGNGGTVTGVVGIKVAAVNDAPIAIDADVSVDEDGVISGNLGPNVTDVEGDTLTFSVDTDVSNGTLELNPDGSVSYTPDADFHGTDSFTYLVDDGNGGTDTATVNITVSPVNDAPVAGSNSFSTSEDVSVGGDVSVNDSDIDGDALVFNVTSDVRDGTLDFHPDGTFVYTPNADFHGTDTFEYEVSDGNGGVGTAKVEIVVGSENDAPVAGDNTEQTDEDAQLIGDVSGDDSDVDGDILTFALTSDVSHGVLAFRPDGTYTYDPAADFHGQDSFTYEVSDGNGGVDTATVRITVNPVNDAPVAVSDVFETNEDSQLVGNVGLNDFDVDGDRLTGVLESGASNGVVSFNPDGSFTYTPDADFNGTDSFTYSLNDGNGGRGRAIVEITVIAVNDAPVFVGPTVIQLTEDASPTVVDFASWFFDVDAADVLTNNVDAVGNDWLNFEVDTNGDLVLSTDPDANGLNSIVVTATDLDGASVTSTVVVDVLPVNDTVTPQDQTFQTGTTDPITGVLVSEMMDVDGQALSVVITSPSPDGDLVVNPDGTFTFDPDNDFVGSTSFSFIVSDGVAPSETATVVVDLLPTGIVLPAVVEEQAEPFVESTEETETTETESEDAAEEDKKDSLLFSAEPDSDASNAGRPDSGTGQIAPAEPDSQEDQLDATDIALFSQQEETLLQSVRRAVSDPQFVATTFDIVSQVNVGVDISSLANVISQSSHLWRELDSFRAASDSQAAYETIAIGSVGTVSSSLIVGYVIWAIRGGLMFSGLAISSMPVWSFLDPLAIVPVADKGFGDESESLEDIVDGNKSE